MDLLKEAYELVKASGEKGILQSDLWKALKVSSREGSRIALKLERDGLIYRKRVLHQSRWTYRLFAVERREEWGPCLVCPELKECGKKVGVNVRECPKLEEWLLRISGSLDDGSEK
ncbi:transcriptional regulator [Thermococci archaeon]|nr:MAG: transcriptional regulator [Thermococci archaeon]RLF94379.1 MAG: transcriptional regulator [Thermococci archaeon]